MTGHKLSRPALVDYALRAGLDPRQVKMSTRDQIFGMIAAASPGMTEPDLADQIKTETDDR